MQGRKARELSARLFVILLAALTAGCMPEAKLNPITPRATVAFESIDGPPTGIFQKLVESLNEEALARRIAVVSRDHPSHYRVRGYLAAHVAAGRTTIAWVWDVYDAGQRRTLRIGGEEQAGRAGADAWTSADDALLQRIARNGMDQLAAFLETPPSGPDTATSSQEPVTLAQAEVLP
jgi:hypothetical protein